MISAKILSTSIFMSLTVPVIAQKSQPVSLQWKVAAILPADSGQIQSTGFAGPVTGMHHDIFLIAGGANFPEAMPWMGGKKKYYQKIFAYSGKQKKLIQLKKILNLPFSIAYPACCTTPDGVLYAGGENENGISNKVWLMQWDAVSQNIKFKNLPDLPVAVSNAAATLVGNTVYIAGGETATAASDQLIALDLHDIINGWKQLAHIPQQVSHTVLTASVTKKSNQVYLVGGRKKNSNGISDLYDAVYMYDIGANSWYIKSSLPYPLSAGTGVAANPNEILIFGGDKGTTFHKVEMLIAAISAEKDEAKKQELILQKNKLQSEHPGFSKEILLYNTLTNTWKVIGNIPFDTPVTTTAVKCGKDILIPSGEIKAGVRSPNILSAIILPKTK
jgi:cyclically-permuted mutarotase family protein